MSSGRKLTRLLIVIANTTAKVIQAALPAERTDTANRLRQTDQQGMVLVKQPGVRRQIRHKKGLIDSITAIMCRQTDATDNAASIGVNNKDWFIGSIKNNGIGCLRSNTVDGQELLAHIVNITGK